MRRSPSFPARPAAATRVAVRFPHVLAAFAILCAACKDGAEPPAPSLPGAPTSGEATPREPSTDARPSRSQGDGVERSSAPAASRPTVSAEEEDLVDEARERGIDYVNVSGTTAKRVVLEANGAGVATLDLGGDGDLDLVFAQGLPSLGALLTGPGADVAVYENDGRGRFTRVDGPGLSGWWTGLAAGDLDHDGDDDLVVGGFGDVAVLVQEAGELVRRAKSGAEPPATMRLVPGEEPPEQAPAWTTSLALFDADGDGVLDLYVGRYLELDPAQPPLEKLGEGPLAIPCTWKGHPVFCGPAGMTPQPDRLLRGRGDGTFVDESSARLPGHVAGFTLGVIAFDADGDLDSDLFVANDSTPNLLLVNDGKGVFTDRAFAAGVSHGVDGRAQAGMGAAFADVDRDGRADVVVTNFTDEPTELYFGADVGFARMTHRFGLLRETRAELKWSVQLADFDGDGWLELLSANGHVYPQADEPHTGTSYGQAASLWKLGPEPKARRIAPKSERSLLSPRIGARGSALGDFDGDGRVDVAFTRIDAGAALGMNRYARAHARLALRLLGPEALDASTSRRTPRDGHGARAIVVVGNGAGEHALLAETHTAAGYQSSSTPWLHFGLGQERSYRSIRILWPSGRVDTLPAGPADERLVVREGQGVIARERFADLGDAR